MDEEEYSNRRDRSTSPGETEDKPEGKFYQFFQQIFYLFFFSLEPVQASDAPQYSKLFVGNITYQVLP